MKQPIRGNNSAASKKRKRDNTSKRISKGKFIRKKTKSGEYGVSKLEAYFAHEFLDKNGYKYIYQYEAKNIKRYFDFVLTSHDEVDYIMEEINGVRSVKQDGQLFVPCLIIEVDGDYWHSNPDKYDESKLTPTQKRNKFVDKIKNRWAGMNCIPILRFWETDIHKNPKMVLDEIKKYMGEGKRKMLINENKKKPH